MLELLARTAVGFLVLVVGLILLALGVSAGAWVALVGLVLAFVVNLLAPLPWNLGWRRMRE
jgi:hypothetical protein